MIFRIFFSDRSKKQLKKLDRLLRGKILKRLYFTRKDPFPHLKELQGSKLWRLRIENYRAILDVVITERNIFVLRVDKRSGVHDR